MRICHLLFGFCMSITLAAAAHADAQPDFKAAVDAYQAQDYARCAEILGALQGAAIPFPSNGELLYAECLAAAGQTDQALRYLDNECRADVLRWRICAARIVLGSIGCARRLDGPRY
ncbi:hypothetical protein [Xanthomonas campestris]|uniref:hypothetical protein n=1 Tax=Xanthomonas campestris TaxID=339 RepID=UPI003CE875B5